MKESITRACLFSLSLLLIYTSCGAQAEGVKTNEPFTLRPGERVTVAGANLSIELKSVGREWDARGGGETPFVELIVTTDDAQTRTLSINKSARVGDYIITLKSANPFRSDDGPRCELVVTRA